MHKKLFKNIVHGVREFHTYFIMNKDPVELPCFSTIHKCTATMRMLVYGVPGNLKDEYLWNPLPNGREVWATLFERANRRAGSSYQGIE
jgi:hypothetical protein